MKHYLIVLTLISSLVILCLCCSDEKSDNSYNYTAYDMSNNKVISGFLTLVFDSSKTSGSWHFDKIGNPPDLGPQVGSGTLVGSRNDSIIDINLNPEWADDNIFLHGTIRDSLFFGTWVWSTLAGQPNRGTFKAII